MKQDKAAAESWYKTGAQLHDPVASYNLGTLFSVDADHPHDLRKAEAYLHPSAADGYIPATHSLGLLLVNPLSLLRLHGREHPCWKPQRAQVTRNRRRSGKSSILAWRVMN
ncbi:sel1 repeat family protein [Tunturiibacter empetritectus]|uniref:TPR repeat protein n=1 Tax=Tunturiibacter lichenicola TaxID=2051959 RepID=A0A852VDC4_9BACT|nr:sel1 repeat family protein [Edaphobacter lichenicola]NYF88275.1 TPR repeat protein [Edaphobacter lichenicola]